ncbi:hypothetical protein DET61_12051 [Marinobacter nauticus]|jgi:hypothetical protein|uniref:Uncharacterized protein n=1 Tax=Marinobacter nauticus TaxID=2743 RepID=A0A368X5F6_MARNT|nr:conjugative transfer protein MobI(A/C) [Marinobacter nauticus]RCW62929.1 hypothetical protein DET61_12051 [Marinobacter nauticus]
MGFDPEWIVGMERILDEQEALITQEAQALVDNYWAQIKERKQNGQNEGRLGVRLIDRKGYKIQIVWYRKTWVGPKNDKKLFSKPIPKGRMRNRYPMQRFTGFAQWEQELAEMFEEDFASIRTLSGAIADQRKALNKAKRAYHEMGYLSADEVDGADEEMDDDEA